jgi:hypothetical protein
MNEPLQLNGTDHQAHDRVAELRTTAREVRETGAATHDGSRERGGLIARTRGSVGRRLISLGATVAGHGA